MGPNDVDQSRLNDTMRGGVVVNLDDYRSQAGTRKTAVPFLDAKTINVAVLVGIALCLALLGLVRR